MSFLVPEEVGDDEVIEVETSGFGFQLTYTWRPDGPVKVHAKEYRCKTILANGKPCHCPTHYTVDGKIVCWLCAIKQLNDIVADLRARQID